MCRIGRTFVALTFLAHEPILTDYFNNTPSFDINPHKIRIKNIARFLFYVTITSGQHTDSTLDALKKGVHRLSH
jgi:hypothetical protein